MKTCKGIYQSVSTPIPFAGLSDGSYRWIDGMGNLLEGGPQPQWVGPRLKTTTWDGFPSIERIPFFEKMYGGKINQQLMTQPA